MGNVNVRHIPLSRDRELATSFLSRHPKLHNGDDILTKAEKKKLLDRDGNGRINLADWAKISSAAYPLSKSAFWRLVALLQPDFPTEGAPAIAHQFSDTLDAKGNQNPFAYVYKAGPSQATVIRDVLQHTDTYARLVKTPKAELHCHFGGNASPRFLYGEALERVGIKALRPQAWGGRLDWGRADHMDYRTLEKGLTIDDVLRRTKGEQFFTLTQVIAEGQRLARELEETTTEEAVREIQTRQVDNFQTFKAYATYRPNGPASLPDALNVYRIASSLVEASPTREVVMAAISDQLREFSRQGVRYVEMRFGAPKQSAVTKQHPGMPVYQAIVIETERLLTDIIEAIQRGNEALIREGLDPVDLRVVYAFSKSRSRSDENFLQATALFSMLKKHVEFASWVVGIDGASREAGEPPELYRDIFDRVQAYNQSVPRNLQIGVTWHQGEDLSDTTVFGAIDRIEQVAKMGATRIGHALVLGLDASFFSPSLEDDTKFRKELMHAQVDAMERLKASGITIEVNPTSNVFTAIPSGKYEDHPLPRFLEHGLQVTINTDDAGLFDTDLNAELISAAVMAGFSEGDLVEIIDQGFRSSFVASIRGESLEHVR
ncbi:MAG: hypothetical protein HY540_04470 [Deltaproteobacteria bacterium]|nr:hypothetical protein [Deltaproteobacteria bacterium]